MTRHRALACGALLLAACSIAPDDQATRIPDEAVPFDLLDPDAPAFVPVADGRTLPICLVRGEHLVPIQRKLPDDASLLDVVRSLASTTEREVREGLESAVSGAEEIAAVTTSSGVAAVDFEPSAAETLTRDPLTTIAQIVCTLTLQPGIGSVRFSVDGTAVDVPRADGSLTDAPVARDDYEVLLDGS